MGSGEQTTGILRGDIQLLRGEELVLFDPGADAYYKISERMANMIGYFSEELPLSVMAEKLRRKGMETDAEELGQITSFLRSNGLLVPRYGETALRQEQLEKLKKKTLLLRLSSSYLFFKLPPWRPDPFFRAAGPFLSFFASLYFILPAALPAFAGYLLALRDSARVLDQFADTLSWAGFAKYILAIVIVKLIHEAAHSLAAVRFHCRVRGIGLGFIFFVPRLYTDTTDSWRLPRRERLLIDGAGIIAELLLGGIAALFWNFLPPGVWQSTFFYIFTTSTLSTLLVNGNVFIRYDGYYILSDLLGIENLMARSGECVRQCWRWYFLRLGAPSGEKRKALLICYGIAAFVYRIFLYTSICVLIYCSFTKVLAVLLLILEFYTLILYPLAREAKILFQLSRRSAAKAVWMMLFAVAAGISSLLFIPFSWGITLPGETVPVRRSAIFVEEGGYLESCISDLPEKTEKGRVIFTLKSPVLEFALEKARRTLEYDRVLFTQQALDEKEFVRKNVTARKIRSDLLALKELQRRKQALAVKAPHDGIFVKHIFELSPGAFLVRNTLIGEVVSPQNMIYAYAAEDVVGKIRAGQKGRVLLPDTLEEIPYRVRLIHPIAVTFAAPSPVLQFFGGEIMAYQTPDGGFSPLQTLYRIELDLPGGIAVGPGRSVRVKLTHSEPLFSSVSKWVISFFRKEF